MDGIDVFCTAVNGYFHSSSSDTSVTARRRTAPELLQPDPAFDAVMIQPSISRQSESRNLKKRDTSSAVLQSPNKKHELVKGDEIFFDCNAQNVECMEIRCKFNNFKPSSRGRVNINIRISSNNTREYLCC